MKKHDILGLLFALFFLNGFSQETRVIPLVFDPTDMELDAVDYVEVAYFLTPDSQPTFEEMAEKIWRIQDHPLLVLGSTGEPLPSKLIRRAELFVQVFIAGQALWSQPRMVHPQKDAIGVTSSSAQVMEDLKHSLGKTANLGATYLADLANYLAGNLSAIDLTASSYAIEGYGEVINTSGEWVGVASGVGGSLWSQSGGTVFVDSEQVAMGTSTPQGKLHVVPSLFGEKGVVVDALSGTAGMLVNGGGSGYVTNGTGFGASFLNSGYFGLHMDQVNSPSTTIPSAVQSGIAIEGVGGVGLYLGHMDQQGIELKSSTLDGIRLGTIGTPSKTVSTNASIDGIEIQGAQGDGLAIGYSDQNGVHVIESGDDGVEIGTPTGHGINIVNPGKSALYIEDSGDHAIEIADSGKYGIKIHNSAWSAIDIDGTTTGAGVSVANTLGEGIYVQNTGEHALRIFNTTATKHGVYIDSTAAGSDGVHIVSSSSDGIEVENASSAGIRVGNCSTAFRSDGSTAGLHVTNCSGIAAYLASSGAGSASPTVKAVNSHANGIAGYFQNSSTEEATLVLANHVRTIYEDLIKAYSGSNGENLVFRVSTGGDVYANVFHPGGADLAESFKVLEKADSYEHGDVMVIARGKNMALDRSQKPYSPLVAGVYATQPGVLLGPDLGVSRIPLGVVGVIPTKVNLEGGAIQPGDLLVTSSEPGVAMKADPARLVPGCVIGKALQLFEGGQDSAVIEVLVNVK